ncbi:hypothetical protein [Streptomyces sp. NPDC006996]|uniref:hypothetical protein n=1 Tax=Streptomyces sp. NPDC006996 TaxID=3156908 RepID=UPI0033DDC3A8
MPERLALVAVAAAKGYVRQLGDDRRQQGAHRRVAGVTAQGRHLVDFRGEHGKRTGCDLQVVGAVVAEQEAAKFRDDGVDAVFGFRLTVVRLAGQDLGAEAQRLRECQHQRR